MGKFGYSMPAGAWESTLPGEEPENEALKCECGAIITDFTDDVKPSRVETWETWWPAPEGDPYINPFSGPFRGEGADRELLFAAGTDVFYTCPSCGKEVKDPHAY